MIAARPTVSRPGAAEYLVISELGFRISFRQIRNRLHSAGASRLNDRGHKRRAERSRPSLWLNGQYDRREKFSNTTGVRSKGESWPTRLLPRFAILDTIGMICLRSRIFALRA